MGNRGAVVAQFNEEPRSESLGLRVRQSDVERLERALAEELKDSRNRTLKVSGLGARMFELGLATYEAREKVGIDRFRAVQADCEGDEAKTLAELIRRGIESWEAEQGKKRGR